MHNSIEAALLKVPLRLQLRAEAFSSFCRKCLMGVLYRTTQSAFLRHLLAWKGGTESARLVQDADICHALLPSRLRKKSVRVEIGGIFGDTKPSPATFLALLGQLCAICFSRFLAQTTFSATC